MKEKLWKKSWFWMFCILSTFFGVFITHALLFPGTPLGRTLVYAVASSVGVLVAYFAVVGKPVFKVQPNTLRRIISMGGGASIGILLFIWIVIPLIRYFDIPREYGPIELLLLLVLMVVCAFAVDTFMKRRDYRPFLEGGGNI